MMKQNTSSRRPQEKLQRNTSTQVLQWRLPLNTSTRWQQKLRSGIQVSKSVQRNCTPECIRVLKEFFFFFLIGVILEKRSREIGMMVCQGRNGPSLVGYLR